MKLELIIALLLITAMTGTSANAGSASALAGAAAGYVIGSSDSNNSGDKRSPSVFVATSEKYDTIMCEADGTYAESCRIGESGKWSAILPPEKYAISAGYKKILKQSAAIVDGKKYIVMEVTK